MLTVVVRELSKAPVCFLFDCCIFIVRFKSLNCYSSAKTRIQLVKSYQINESFLLNNPLCITAPFVSFDCYFDAFSVSRAPSLSIELTALLFSSLKLNLKLHLNRILNFSIMFSHHVSVRDITVPTLWTYKSMQVPFNV